jgi:hypothetical protein
MFMAFLKIIFFWKEVEVTIYQHSFKVKIKIKYPFLVRIILLHLFSN